jgi:KipI family sensor histidine kinase inhibitor
MSAAALTGSGEPAAELTPYGDAALMVTASTSDAEARWELVHRLAAHLNAHSAAGLTNLVPTYDCLLVSFDPVVTDHDEVADVVRAAIESGAASSTRRGRSFELPVVYGGDRGPDLDRVAKELEMTAEEIVAAHTAAPVKVRVLGPSGGPLLDGPPLRGPVKRLTKPRVSVPEGSVGLAGEKTVLYPREMPGGWRLIGRTPLRLVDVDADPPVAYAPGDTVRFVRIGENDWDRLAGRPLRASSDD